MQQGEQPPGESDEYLAPRDRWWFSPTLQLVVGAAVLYLQWGPISAGTANPFNWLLGLIGVGVVVMGAIGLWRARPEDPTTER